MVRLRGLEPPRRFQRYHLKVVRLPIPPQPHVADNEHQPRPSIHLRENSKTPQVSERFCERKRQIGHVSMTGFGTPNVTRLQSNSHVEPSS
jgi:hypothetical protein